MTVRRIVAAAIGIAVLAGAGCSSEPAPTPLGSATTSETEAF
ncbi:hypothetical protein [Kribbella capetownensis]|nr:hypothetical protein [Kribbella capetownensis]